MEFMITLRNADGSDGVGPVRYLTFTGEMGTDNDLALNDWRARVIATFPAGDRNPAGHPDRTGDILFLVHGFNESHESAKALHLKCVKALADEGWFGRVISYDWPSDGLVFAYLPDRVNARAAASALVSGAIAVLEGAQQTQCTINVHVLAHSMGGFVVQQAFTWSYQDVPADWRIGQLMFAAADVDYTVFEVDTPSTKAFASHAGRLTAYSNRYDKALLVSNAKRLELAPRMGRVGLPDTAPPMMCEVNCSALFEKVFPGIQNDLSPSVTHSFYFDRPEFWRDVVLNLGGGIDRGVFPTREPDPSSSSANRFELDPAGIDDATYWAALARAATSPSIRVP
ncbi:alpha/beta fold hydrolase [Dyella humicola]|uniref:alpha/beta fold hydrolase n=1 Tax=Dyella humicola TaxID=2992126 RepID=UPI00224F6C1A|nr:alpha/beta fold hydrolase [Dyella humicola]